jgi:hypothetical protein
MSEQGERHEPLGLPLWSYSPLSGEEVEVSSRADLDFRIVRRALREEGFGERLAADPAGVLTREFGTVIPNGVRINVLQETESDVYLVLPRWPYKDITTAELQSTTGLTVEDVAGCILQAQRSTLLDAERSAALVSRAWADSVFRAAFLNDPRGVLENTFDLTLPNPPLLHALQETAEDLFIVLPQRNDRVSEPDDWEQANLGPAHAMMIAQSDRCARTCIVLTPWEVSTDTACWVTCVDREMISAIYRR